MRNILSKVGISLFLFSIIFSIACCGDMSAANVVVQNPDEQVDFQPEHLAAGKYTSHQGYEYIICDKTETGCDDCYRTKTLRVIHEDENNVSIHFFIAVNTEEGTRVKHEVMLNPCSYRQVRINSNDSVEHRRQPTI